MKILFLFFFLVLLASTRALSQKANEIALSNYEEKAQAQTNSMKAYLTLTGEQSDSIFNINKRYFFRIASLRGLNKNSQNRGLALQQIERDRNERLAAILTKDQLNKYTSRQEDQKTFLQKQRDKVKEKQKTNK